MTYLCDTNIISELARRRPNRGVVQWASRISSIALSVITLEEIFFGLAWKPNINVRQWFESFFDQYCELLPVTPEIANRCGQLRGELRKEGRTLSQANTLIAATAELHQLTLVTRNVRDFDGLRIPLLNPFQSSGIREISGTHERATDRVERLRDRRAAEKSREDRHLLPSNRPAARKRS